MDEIELAKLYALSLLWAFDFETEKQYNDALDELFLATPDDAQLLALEECSGDKKETFFCLRRYVAFEKFPYELREVKEFETLRYADIPLDWGDENGARTILEELFHCHDCIS